LVTLDLLAELAKTPLENNMSKLEFDNAVALIKAAALDKAGRIDEAWQFLTVVNIRRKATGRA
jgi:hypothetical protein